MTKYFKPEEIFYPGISGDEPVYRFIENIIHFPFLDYPAVVYDPHPDSKTYRIAVVMRHMNYCLPFTVKAVGEFFSSRPSG